MKTYKDFNCVIVTCSKYGRPMVFDGHQFCYCENEYWEDEAFPVKIYFKETARKYIRLSNKYRKKQGFDLGGYILYPVVVNN